MSDVKEIDLKESSIVEGLLNESALKHLFESLCFADIENIKMIETYACNSEHTGLIVEAKNKNTNDKETIIVDAVAGYPMTEQVFDTLYKKGSNCNKRIIIYTKGSTELDRCDQGDDIAIKNLVENLNGYGSNIFLVKMKDDSDKGRFRYIVTEKPSENQDYEIPDLPSEEELREEEFWEYYYWSQFQDGIYPWHIFTGPMDGERRFGDWYEWDRGTLYATWSDEGLFYELNYKDNQENWNNKLRELRLLFPDAEITTFKEAHNSENPAFKIWSTPVQSLMNASISEKKRLASEMLVKFWNFKKIITSPPNDIRNEKIDEVQGAEQLAQTE